MGKLIDLTGQKFGKWTPISIIEKRDKNKNKRIYWLCECYCGNKKEVPYYSLISGSSKSCGTYRCSHNYKNIVNRKFGKLIAIDSINKHSGSSVVWLCRCECGKEKEVPVHRLMAGTTKSCGKNECRSNFMDLKGKIFGKLTAIKFCPGTEGGRTSWDCICSCGKSINVHTLELTSGDTKSCGCLKFDKQYLSIGKAAYRHHLFNVKSRNGIVNYLSEEEYLSISSLPCHFCGKLDVKTNVSTGAIILLNGIDRMNNEKYYRIENSLPCCGTCNIMKMDSAYADFIEKIHNIYRYISMKSTQIERPIKNLSNEIE